MRPWPDFLAFLKARQSPVVGFGVVGESSSFEGALENVGLVFIEGASYEGYPGFSRRSFIF